MIASAEAQVSKQEVIDAVNSEATAKFVLRIKAMDSDAQRKSALVIVNLIKEYFVTGEKYGEPGHSEGVILMGILGDFSDDATLANALRIYTDSKESNIRNCAFRALSQGRGPAVAEILAENAGLSFAKLPKLPYQPVSEGVDREVSAQSIIFTNCLIGLLKSQSQQARHKGARYLEMFRERYSGNEEGRKGIAGVEKELRRSGISLVDVGKGLTQNATNKHNQQTTPYPSPATRAAAEPLSQPGKNPSSFSLWLVLASIAAITTVLALLFRKRG